MGQYSPKFSCKENPGPSVVIFDHEKKVGEVVDGRLRNALLRPDGPIVVDNDIGLRMFWMQYADHQKPGRSADIIKKLSVDDTDPTQLILHITTTNVDESIESRYGLTLSYDQELESYYYLFEALLTVLPKKTWLVTFNPSNGELEYCNFWPNGVFEKDKLWQVCCYEALTGETLRVAHHHLNSADKILRPFKDGGRLVYLLEDDNPVVQLLGDTAEATETDGPCTAAGLCAYMYDVHFAYRLCDSQQDVLLPAGSTYRAEFALYRVGRKEGERILEKSTCLSSPEIDAVPIFVEGLNTFSRTLRDVQGDPLGVWPWSIEYGDSWDAPHGEQLEGITYVLDRALGYSDSSSLRIHSKKHCSARWAATTIGPAFFGKDFEVGKRYLLSAYVKTNNVEGEGVAIGIRLHRENPEQQDDIAGLEAKDFETYCSSNRLVGTNDWTRLEIVTPPITPKPDRVHLLLEQNGRGTTWFDDVEYREE